MSGQRKRDRRAEMPPWRLRLLAANDGKVYRVREKRMHWVIGSLTIIIKPGTPRLNRFRVRNPDSEGNQMHLSIVWTLRIAKM